MANGSNGAIREFKEIRKGALSIRKRLHKMSNDLMVLQLSISTDISKLHERIGVLSEKLKYPLQETKD